MSENSLAIFTKAAQMLAEADTIQKCKELKDLALTAADWARRKNAGEEAIQYARSYALEAERKMGEMLAVKPEAYKAGPGRGHKGSPAAGLPLFEDPIPALPTIEDLGLTKNQSSNAQFLAKLPDEDFEQIKAGDKTLAEVKREQRREEHAERIANANAKQTNLQDLDTFGLVLADPPWQYDFVETENRAIENQYPTATLEEICAHKPKTAEDAILFLWATAPKLKEALAVMEAWGFGYKTHAVWHKEKIGMGYWFRGQHELLLVGTKGSPGCTPECERVGSVFSEARRGHSQKPECVYSWIERAFPGMAKLEMYSREPRPGWIAWGNEA